MTMKKKKKRFRWLKRLLIWLVLLAAAAIAVKFILLPKLDAEATITYDSYSARIGTISNSLSFSGSISVQNNETISADSSATVRQIYVTEGEKVTRGQRLMRLSNGDTIKASFDGEVNKISVQVGDEVNGNASLIQIVDFENMQVSMRVDEYSISDLKVGQDCRITVTALGETFNSKISHINRISSGGGNTAYTTAMKMNSQSLVTGITVYMEDADASDQVQATLEEHLDALFSYEEDTYSITTMDSIESTMDSMLSMMSALLAGIASIALVVGGIGIMNMMLTSVTERTVEIGLKKAIGAEPGLIQIQFLIESFLLSMIGGLAGVVLGLVVSAIMCTVMGTAFTISYGAIALGVGFSAAVGIVFGWSPARKASKLSPIDALRRM